MHEVLERLIREGQGKRIACYGAGDYACCLLAFLRDRGMDIDLFVVTEAARNQEPVLGVQVVALAAVREPKDFMWVVCVSAKYRKAIQASLHARGIDQYVVIDRPCFQAACLEATKKNKELHQAAKRDRCFLLGMGPSIRRQNLKLLRNEVVYTCSFVSLLPEYGDIQPEFYTSAALVGDEFKDTRYIMEVLRFYEETISSPTLILDCWDRPYIQEAERFKGKKVYYMLQDGQWSDSRRKIYRLDKNSPGVQTGSIMMLKVAMAMGYKKIYLLGMENDLVRKTYDHAYDLNTAMKQRGFSWLGDRMIESINDVKDAPNRSILRMCLHMYEQYHHLHEIARHNGIEIYNATLGGSLDEFPRVSYETLF